MWSVVLKILSILGIILLILLGIVLTAVLLVLFVPVVYRGSGSAHADGYRASFRFRWLFGLVRGEYTYPEDGVLRIKALWMTLYDSGGKQQNTGTGAVKSADAAEDLQDVEEDADAAEILREEDAAEPSQDVENADAAETLREEDAAVSSQNRDREKRGPESESSKGLVAKWSVLKKKLQPYLEIVRDEDNQALVRHVMGRLGRILKSIRPQILRLEALIGLGEPDTTGYVYGICWAVKPFLGRKCRIAITPDFERQVLEGEIFLRGHIMGAVLLNHIVKVLLDKRLWQLLDRLKKIQE